MKISGSTSLPFASKPPQQARAERLSADRPQDGENDHRPNRNAQDHGRESSPHGSKLVVIVSSGSPVRARRLLRLHLTLRHSLKESNDHNGSQFRFRAIVSAGLGAYRVNR
jgi:hypothetical protein